ncbi:MAG: O-antigen ligase family protein, partial [Actinomycetota bacterium]
GYANADGAFFAEASIAGLMLAAASRRTEARVLGGGAAAAFAAVPFVRGSLAAAALVVVLPIMGLVCIWLGGPRLGVAACAALFLLVLVGTVILGARYAPGRPGGTLDRLVDATLSQRRVALWHDALVIMVEHPTGVGPGRFAVASPTARADVDARWAHNGFLQQGAEAGPVGFTLIVLLFLWAFARLWMSPAPDVVTVLGAAALAALGIHACIDYVLHFPAVPIVTAALVGAAAGPAVPLDPSVLRGDQDARRDARP